MKRYFVLVLCAVAFLQPRLWGADDPGAKQELEERVTKLTADVEGLLAANVALQKSLSRVADEVKALREEQTRQASTQNTQDDLKRLAEKIQEVDKKREADKDLIVEQISKLGKSLASGPGPAHASEKKAGNNESGGAGERTERIKDRTGSDKGYEYVIQKGDLINNVVADFNAEFRKKGMKTVTVKQVLDANPKLKPEKMYVGQKIFIPLPAQ